MSIEVTVPALGESIVEATVGRWLKNQGENIAAGEALVELETDKVNMEVVAPDAGTLQSIVKGEGETVEVGDVLATIDAAAAGASPNGGQTAGSAQRGAAEQSTSNPADAPAAPPEHAPSAPDDGQGGRVSPLARRIAAEHGVDVTQVPGSGPSGRVMKDDVAAFIARTEQQASRAPVPSAGPPPLPAPPIPSVDGERPEERVRMSRRRQTIARRLVEAQQTAAMLTTFNEIDMTAIMEVRKRRREQFKERYGIGLGFMSFFTKAVIGALKEYPRLNAEIQGDEIILKHYYDMGIAVGTDEGLVVPVVRNADRLTFAEIEREIASLAEKARTGQLSLAELQGGTFTISNGGIYGSLLSTPILNTPQVGILGMHKIQERPIALNGQVVISPMMYLALSYDHRIVDGSEAVRFLVRVKEMLEDPERLLLEG
jgi:2-oxoglutarate dehydrogenase E2 component (dihydrolipoamide succinyltransferase)